MAGIDINKLKQAQEELEKRSGGGGKNWIQVNKIEDPIDVRIMEPHPVMDGLYYLEVPVWWINGIRVISPKLVGEADVIEQVIEDAKKSKDSGLKKLLEATNEHKAKKVQFGYEFWIPVMQFNWEFDSKESIKGIYNDKNEVDPELIRKFVADDRVKIMVSKISLLKDINKIITARQGGVMTDPDKGFNLVISKTGKGRDTKYGVIKSDSLPMPLDFYEDPKMINPLQIAQALMHTDEYMDRVIGKYLYNEELPEMSDEFYRYPEIREEMKSRTDDEEEEAPAPRQRPGRAATAAPAAGRSTRAAAADTQEEATEEQAPPARTRPAAPAAAAPARAVRTATTTAPPAAARPAGRRNLIDDIQDTE